jgi:hypothetical protein
MVASAEKNWDGRMTLPEPLRGVDEGSFAENTIRVRLKAIGQRTLQEGAFPSEQVERLQELLDDLPDGRIRRLLDQEAPDAADWEGYSKPYLGLTWLQVPWFFAETYFYRRILEASGYFVPGKGLGVDPYEVQKRQGLVAFTTAIQSACGLSEAWLVEASRSRKAACGFLPGVLGWMIWGNQADLSMWPVEANAPAGRTERPNHASHLGVEDDPRRAYLVCNDTQAVQAYGCQTALPRLDIILDNSGLELVHDLVAADFLLRTEVVGEVWLHAKSHPTFVSDTIPVDVTDTIAFMLADGDSSVCTIAERLQTWLKNGALRVASDFYWTSPLAFWDVPERVKSMLSGSSLVISKGDANYRRFLGDRHWPYDLPAKAALGYLDFPFLALRVLKSDIVVGLRPGQAQRLAQQEPDWMTNGRWGMAQWVNKNF